MSKLLVIEIATIIIIALLFIISGYILRKKDYQIVKIKAAIYTALLILLIYVAIIILSVQFQSPINNDADIKEQCYLNMSIIQKKFRDICTYKQCNYNDVKLILIRNGWKNMIRCPADKKYIIDNNMIKCPIHGTTDQLCEEIRKENNQFQCTPIEREETRDAYH